MHRICKRLKLQLNFFWQMFTYLASNKKRDQCASQGRIVTETQLHFQWKIYGNVDYKLAGSPALANLAGWLIWAVAGIGFQKRGSIEWQAVCVCGAGAACAVRIESI